MKAFTIKDNWSDGYHAYVEFTYTNIGTTTTPELDAFFA